MSETIDGRRFREVLGQYPTGVCVVTALQTDGTHAGFVVGSFTSVSLDPPLVAFFPDKGSSSWPKIRAAEHFCVNILSADQEHLCRQFASKTGDKFQDVPVRPASSGAPIIEDAVAWIDCDLESVSEAGDHYIVLGRVRELGVESPDLPLLFFQGGYGRFAPLSLAASSERGALASELREVDLVRGEMEKLASDLTSRCIATIVRDDDLVVLASAGSPDARARATLVGVHLPFTLHYGSAFAAWLDDSGNWLKQISDDSERAEQERRLDVVRSRGYSLGLINDAQREFALALDQLAEDPDAHHTDTLRALVSQLEYEPAELTDATLHDVRVIAVPVFRPDGDVALVLTVYGFSNPDRDGGIGYYIERVRASAEEATRLLSAR